MELDFQKPQMRNGNEAHSSNTKGKKMSGKFMYDLVRQYLPELHPRQAHALTDYLFLLKKWNRVYNLTSITTAKAMVIRHILDSVSISPFLVGKRIIDVGTGAGLPGIPLAILNPKRKFVLLDSNNKKARFLRQAKMELQLNNVEIVHSRIEEYKNMRRFDCIISRAFSSLNEFFKSSEHLLLPRGCYLAMKGVYPLSELKAVEQHKYIVNVVEKLEVPDLTAERHVAIATLSDQGFSFEENSGNY
jgi:16S rRNA (guanine527-N7)-methyltransferase